MRAALSEALGAIGADPTRSQHISRLLKLDKSLAWKISKIVTDDDPFAAIPRLPGRAGVRILLESLEQAKIPPAALSELRDAMADFDKMVETHAGTRETLQMMLGNQHSESRRERDESHRKLAFQGNSAIWGAQARVQLSSHFIAPSATMPDRLDIAIISGLIDFRRLRHDVPWAVATARLLNDMGELLPLGELTPMDESVAPGGVPMMREFCSPSLPPLNVVRTHSGRSRFEIGQGPVGNSAAATCMTGWINRACVSPYASPDNRYGENHVTISTPTEVLFHDLFVHESLAFALHPALSVYSLLPGGPTYPADGHDKGLLSVETDILNLGLGPPDLTTHELPRYRQMVEFAAGRIGYPLNQFYGFRYKLRFPPIPALAVFRYRLPEK